VASLRSKAKGLLSPLSERGGGGGGTLLFFKLWWLLGGKTSQGGQIQPTL